MAGPEAGDGSRSERDAPPAEVGSDVADPDMNALIDKLHELADAVDAPEERAHVRETIHLAREVPVSSGVFGQVIRGFTRRDKGEAFVGSVVFGLPMLVEDGVLSVGAYLAVHPALWVAQVAFTVLLVYGLVYVSDFQRVEITNPYFGVVPRRLLWILVIAYATSFALMTGWGRVDWTTPWVDLCRVTVTFTGMAVGAALGDILPGSSAD